MTDNYFRYLQVFVLKTEDKMSLCLHQAYRELHGFQKIIAEGRGNDVAFIVCPQAEAE